MNRLDIDAFRVLQNKISFPQMHYNTRIWKWIQKAVPFDRAIHFTHHSHCQESARGFKRGDLVGFEMCGSMTMHSDIQIQLLQSWWCLVSRSLLPVNQLVYDILNTYILCISSTLHIPQIFSTLQLYIISINLRIFTFKLSCLLQ